MPMFSQQGARLPRERCLLWSYSLQLWSCIRYNVWLTVDSCRLYTLTSFQHQQMFFLTMSWYCHAFLTYIITLENNINTSPNISRTIHVYVSFCLPVFFEVHGCNPACGKAPAFRQNFRRKQDSGHLFNGITTDYIGCHDNCSFEISDWWLTDDLKFSQIHRSLMISDSHGHPIDPVASCIQGTPPWNLRLSRHPATWWHNEFVTIMNWQEPDEPVPLLSILYILLMRFFN